MRCHQLVHTLNYGDAISGGALLLRRVLQEEGLESEIICVHAHEKLKGECRRVTGAEDLLRVGEADSALLLHYSIASPLNTLFENSTDHYRFVVYHNLTPDNWFWGYNSRVVADLRQGRRDLARVVSLADGVIADSAFNGAEIASYSRSAVGVIPFVFDPQRWSMPSNAGIAAALRGHGGKNVLYVGRLAPNKCIEDVIKAFYFYHHKIEKQSRLWLVGSDIDTEIYSFELRKLVRDLHLDEAVSFVGSVADSELKAFYENSDVYLAMSEHEGFCVPLIEAMSFRLPVIAFDSTAVAETAADGALLLARKSPAEVAELLHLVISDRELRAQVIEAGTARVAGFTLDVFRQKAREFIVGPLQEWNQAKNREQVRVSSRT